MNKKPQAKPPFVFSAKGDDGSKISITLDDRAYQYLMETARMFASGDPGFRHQADERFREIGKVLGAIENRQLWQAMINKENAQKKRPAAATPEADEIKAEFDRLVREGFTEGEARGKLLSWDRWSQSTIYRHTTSEEK